MISSKLMSEIHRLLKNFIGCRVKAMAKSTEDNFWNIEYNCYCKESLIAIASCPSAWQTFGCYDYKELEYTMFLDDNDLAAKELIGSLRTFLKYKPHLRENFQLTNYKELNKKGRIAFVELIKHIRSQHPDGLSNYNAKEALDLLIICNKCKTEIFTEADILNLIIESEGVKGVYDKLTTTECQCMAS